MDYRSIIESKYNRTDWQNLLHDIFRQNIKFWQQPAEVSVDENMAKSALYIGKISLPDGHAIAVYEVELSDKVVIERNRAGIRNLLCTNWRGMGCAGAFMFCYRQNESVLRFSYVSESFVFAEDGCLKKESTDTKRFTYLLGEGHRSRTAIDQFEKLKKSCLDLKAVTKAFSVEALSKSFFDDYKKQYEDIVEFVTGKRMVKVSNKWVEKKTCEPCSEIMREFAVFHDAEKAVRDYVKKLMGRLVFIQFLQKKGWMGCPAGEAWKNGDREFVQNLFANTQYKETFVDDVLEPLFNDINTKRHGDLTSSPNVGKNIKIPYLNGGLFENDDYDNTKFPLPAKYMKSMLDFFASYNFTIDENDPDDAEIGVDPEMLGRIFENLLEDNKDKGAFYTPKEIVQYMCRESLIAYLQTDITEEGVKESIRQFVTSYDATSLNEELKEVIDQKLKDVKICDPAIGSGAFPMGLLRELYACRKAIEGIDDVTAVSIKTHIIQNNIYGVDFEKGAVDIARLRFWLALIVDEQNPHALPNMDFKIMLGNSLLEQYEGVDLSGMSLNEQEKKKSRSKKQEAWQQTFAFDENDALKNIQNAIREYYLTDDHAAKSRLRDVVNENVRNYIRNLKGCTPDILKKLESLPIPNNQFFLWHIYFKDVFDKGGFDIVIGNPPYGVSIKDDYRKNVVSELGQVPDYEIYYYFIELSKKLLADKGILSYIVPNTWLFNTYAKKYRENIFNSWIVDEILDCSKFKIFDSATVMNTVFRFRLTENSENSNYVGYRNTMNALSFSSLTKEGYTLVSKEDVLNMNQNWGLVFRLNKERVALVNKITSNGTRFDTFFPEISQGLIAYDKYRGQSIEIIKNRAYHYSEFHEGLKKMIWGEDVTRYSVNWNGKEWIDYCDGIANPRQPKFFIGKRLLVREITNPSIYATITEEELYNDPAVIIALDNDLYCIEVALGVLNSKIATFYHFNHSPKSTKGSFPKILVQDVKEFPLPNVSQENADKIKKIVNEILRLKKKNNLVDTNSLEHRIDLIVYQLYGLTDDEIAIIENSTK